MTANSTPKLSICIATYKRGQFIGETLNSILAQIEPGVEIVVVDGASPDDTSLVMAGYTAAYPEISYFRELVNSGVDADFDKAVVYAKGEYCWLMTDDDLLRPGAIKRVLLALGGESDLIIVNAEVRSADLYHLFESKRLGFNVDKFYRAENREEFFVEIAAYLSFIGCVVIRRTCWIERERCAYYGSLFIHVGVIFQNPPITNVRTISEPQIIIRYGNAMWTPRSFEVWMFKWPELIWTFLDFSDEAKRKVCRREPWRSAKALFHNRALGSYSPAVFTRFLKGNVGNPKEMIFYLLSVFPASLANLVMVAYFLLQHHPNRMALHDLIFCRNAGLLSRLLVRFLAKGI